jgi:hypothetical protein
MWYAVSLLFCGSSTAKPHIALWRESIKLIEADSEEVARILAAKDGESAEHSYEVEGTIFTWSFRSIQSVFYLEDFRLESGVEVFSRFLKQAEAESLLSSFGERSI